MCVLEGHTAAVTCLSYGPDDLLASCSWDSTARVWDTVNKKIVKVLEGHSSNLTCCSYVTWQITVILWPSPESRRWTGRVYPHHTARVQRVVAGACAGGCWLGPTHAFTTLRAHCRLRRTPRRGSATVSRFISHDAIEIPPCGGAWLSYQVLDVGAAAGYGVERLHGARVAARGRRLLQRLRRDVLGRRRLRPQHQIQPPRAYTPLHHPYTRTRVTVINTLFEGGGWLLRLPPRALG